MSYLPQYTKPYANGYVDRPSKETPERASFINARDDTLIRIEKYLSTLNFDGKYALLTEAGYSLELSIDEYYVLTISLKNKAGTVISSKQIDFPIESMIINVDYNEDTGIITFNLQNGQSLEVNISTLVRGLVADKRTIAGIDLKDDITAEELKEALGMYDEGLTAGTLKPWLYDTENEVEIGVYNGKPLYRQVYVYEEVSIVGGMAYVTIDVENPEEIYIENAYAVAPDGGIWPIPYAHSNAVNNIGVFISSDYKGLNFRLGTAHEGTVIKACVILNYTKTTDLEGSGNSLKPYGIYDAKLDAVEEQLSDKVLPQYKNYSFPAEGWYRVAELSSTSTAEIRGAAPYILDLQINRTYANTPPESHRITIASNYTTVGATVEFTGEMSFAEGLMIPKIRVTADTSNNKAYVELYFRYLTIGNNVVLSLSNRMNSVPRAWTLINAVTTEESVEGITVLGIYEFSRNKSYKSEIKATDNTIIKYGSDTKEQALGYLNNPTTISAEWNDTRCYNFLFQDLVGDGPFNGGGIAEILGYTYGGGLYSFQMAFKYNMSPRWRQNLNGTWGEWVLLGRQSDIDAINSRLAYKDISSSIDVGDSGCTASGYVESGQVCINIKVPQGSSSNILSQIHVATNYAPRNTTGGYLTIIGTGSDIGKLSGTIMADGAVSIFVTNALDASEIISFTYPLKSS